MLTASRARLRLLALAAEATHAESPSGSEANGATVLVEGALCIAAEEQGGADVARAFATLDALGSAAAERVRGARDVPARLAVLSDFLHRRAGFRGNAEHYYDPRNSFLDQVLARRTGIPLTLAMVWIEVGARCGLVLRGVGFPGHFLLALDGEARVLVDPFEGDVVDDAWCRARLRTQFGSPVPLQEAHLREATPLDMWIRMLSNLEQIYVRGGAAARALACSERIALLSAAPGPPPLERPD